MPNPYSARPGRAGAAGGRGRLAASGGGATFWRRAGEGLSVASVGARGGAALRQAAWRRAGPRGIDTAGEAILRALVTERNYCTLDEYRELLAVRSGGPQVSRPIRAGPCGGSGYGAKKDAARQQARSRRHPSGAGGLPRTDAAARRQEPGLPRRERHHHGGSPLSTPARGAASGHTARPRAASRPRAAGDG